MTHPTPTGKKERQGKKCGAKLRKKDRHCQQPAGARTNHVGIGKCWLHGGATPIKHGLYSSVVSEQNQALVEQLSKSPDLSSLDKEIALFRVIIHEFSEKTKRVSDGIAEGTPDRLQAECSRLSATCEQIEQLSRVIQRKSAIDTAAAVKLTPSLILQFVQIVEATVARYLPKSDDFAAFGRDLRAALPLVGTGEPVRATGE